MFYPSSHGYTIYSKENCVYCERVKELLVNELITMYSCVDFMESNREGFHSFMDTITGRVHRTFPFVFHNGVFIGGHDDTKTYLSKEFSFSDDF